MKFDIWDIKIHKKVFYVANAIFWVKLLYMLCYIKSFRSLDGGPLESAFGYMWRKTLTPY